jgi:hypothetical protein
MSGSPCGSRSNRLTGFLGRQVGIGACAILTGLAMIAPGSAIAAPPHAAANTEASLPPPARKPGWWSGTCDKKRTPGSSGPIWHGLVSCGPGLVDDGVYETGPVSANVEWQCVDLVQRWLYLEFNLKQVVSVANDPTPDGTNGYEVVRHYAYAIAHAFKPGHYPLRKITPAQAQKAHMLIANTGRIPVCSAPATWSATEASFPAGSAELNTSRLESEQLAAAIQES